MGDVFTLLHVMSSVSRLAKGIYAVFSHINSILVIQSNTSCHSSVTYNTLVNVYVDLLVFTRIAGTSYTGSGRY